MSGRDNCSAGTEEYKFSSSALPPGWRRDNIVFIDSQPPLLCAPQRPPAFRVHKLIEGTFQEHLAAPPLCGLSLHDSCLAGAS